MKNVLCCLVLIIILFSGLTFNVSAQNTRAVQQSTYQITELRAGGGSGGGGSGSRGLGRRISRGIRRSFKKLFGGETLQVYDYIVCAFGIIIIPVSFVYSVFLSVRCIYRKHKRIHATKDMLEKLSNSDNAWKYDKLIERVTKSYFAIQKAWTKDSMESVRQYMSNELFEEFQQKLDAMKKHNERNVLKSIKLNKYYAAAVKDSPEDEFDCVWFYIGGSMVDYIYNFEMKKITQGNTKTQHFVEYWKFVRNELGDWVLAKIVQENDRKNLPFHDEQYVRRRYGLF